MIIRPYFLFLKPSLLFHDDFSTDKQITDFFVINDSQYNFTLQQFQNPKKSFSSLKTLSGFHFYQKDQQIVHHVWAFTSNSVVLALKY